MDLPINDEELNTIVKWLGFGGDAALYHKLKLVKELKEQGLPYKKILREEYGMVCWWLNWIITLKSFQTQHSLSFLKLKKQWRCLSLNIQIMFLLEMSDGFS